MFRKKSFQEFSDINSIQRELNQNINARHNISITLQDSMLRENVEKLQIHIEDGSYFYFLIDGNRYYLIIEKGRLAIDAKRKSINLLPLAFRETSDLLFLISVKQRVESIS